MVEVVSQHKCILGEGAFWHPERAQFFWFDILGKKLLTIKNGEERHWSFDECVSAAGWVSLDRLLIASASALLVFDLKTGDMQHVTDLEADNPATRSNDGRADPWGGFWIGTMGYKAEPGAGAIYRYYNGRLRMLVSEVTISNAICFAPNRTCAYYTDTATGKVLRQALEPRDGWPKGEPEVFLDLSKEDFGSDGAVVDTEGRFWNAQWGASRVACYGLDGALLETVSFPTEQVSCPAFGGLDLRTLFATTASDGVGDVEAGKTFKVETSARGQREHQVIL